MTRRRGGRTTRDFSCVLSFVLFCAANVLNAIDLVREENDRRRHDDGDDAARERLDAWYRLDPDGLRALHEDRSGVRTSRTIGGVVNAFAWFSLVIPVVRVAMVLSKGGRRRPGAHALMVSLVLGASFTETLCRLIDVGVDLTVDWIATDFNLDDWGLGTTKQGSTTTTSDGTGRRAVEVLYLLSRGFTLWVEAFEFLALGGIMLIVFFSLSTELPDGVVSSSSSSYSFPRCWGSLSFVVALLSLATFAVHALRVDDHPAYARVHAVVTVFNAFVLLPLWFLSLSTSLPEALVDYETRERDGARAPSFALRPLTQREL